MVPIYVGGDTELPIFPYIKEIIDKCRCVVDVRGRRETQDTQLQQEIAATGYPVKFIRKGGFEMITRTSRVGIPS
jgi:hypothetical protein